MNYTTSPAFSIPSTQRKVFEVDQDASPGPTYNTYGLNQRHQSLSFGIGKSARTKINQGIEKTPAPGFYNPQTIKNQKGVTIPKSVTKIKPNQDMVDPAFYQPNYQVLNNKILTYSMGNKYPSIMDDIKNTPGPGQYDTIGDLNKMRNKSVGDLKLLKSKSTFNTSAPRFISTKQAPGPGDYQLLCQNPVLSPDNKGKFATSPKHFPVKQITPGPSEYQNFSRFDQAIKYKLGKTFGFKPSKSSLMLKQDATKNAFGNYQIIANQGLIKQKSKAFSIGKSPRKVFEGNTLPGPLDYIKERYENKNVIAVTLPTSRRKQIVQNFNPGPGEYTLIDKKASTYTIPRSQSQAAIIKNPGVGRYDVDKLAISKGYKGNKFQNSHRTNFISKNLAGVGDYQIQQKRKQPITIPKSQRFRKQQTHKPGPGDYYIQSTIGKINRYSSYKKL